MDIYPTLQTIFSEVFDEDGLTISPATTAADVEGWDSLAHLRLMLAAEQEFGVRFSAAEIAALTNVGDLAALIQSKL